VHGLVKVLERHNYLQITKTGRYRLGIAAYELGRSYTGNAKLATLAEPMVRYLNQKYAQSVHMAIYTGRRAVFILDSRADTGHSIFPRVGVDIMAYCTAVGKALLAWQSPEHRELYLKTEKLLPYTQNTICNPDDLRRELDTIREQGFAVDREEILAGTACIAAPIFGYSGQVIAAISLSGPPEVILKESNIAPFSQDVMQAARRISETMGYRPVASGC
jgi:DNA-binding IclR family transcriptional regulator